MAEESRVSDRFPPCWSDDERMGYLFSDFRQNRTVNPKDWDNKLKFWSQLVENCCRKDRCVFMECERMVESFRRKGKLPMGINRVLREMVTQGQIVRMEDFVNNINGGWVSWGVHNFVRRPVSWAIGMVSRNNERNLEGSYVVVDVLKEVVESVLDIHRQSDSMDNLVEYNILQAACRSVCGDVTSLDLALLYLQKMKKVHVETLSDGSKVVKFVSKEQRTVGPLTETELGILSLRKTIGSLKKQREQSEREIQNLHLEAALTVRKGLKSSAKNILRRKKILERTLEKTEMTLHTLQELLDQIQGAQTNTRTLEAYRAGASALKQTLKSNGLTPEQVDDTMSEVQEVMELCAEIGDVMSQGNQAIDDSVSFSAGIDTDLLEAELASLLDNETSASKPTEPTGDNSSKESDFLNELPEVPKTQPTSLEEKDQTASTLMPS